MRPTIVVSAQAAALGVVRSLSTMGVPVVLLHYGEHDFAHRSRYLQSALRAPHPEKEEREFIDFLVDCGSRFRDAVLIPASDESLAAVSRHKDILDQHYRVACPGWQVTEQLIDKHLTDEVARRCGVASPRTLIPLSREEARSGAAEMGLPCLIKPRESHRFYDRFHKKMVQADTLEEVEQTFSMARDAGLQVMLQELIPGDDTNVVNYNSYVWEGEVLAEFTAVHVRNGPPWYGPPRVAVSRRVPEVLEPGRQLLRAMGFNGYSCIEFKRDPRDGTYKVLDVNGRHNLSTLLAVRCGINFPWLHYAHLSEGMRPQVSGYREEVYWIDLIRDVGYSVKNLMRESTSFMDYLRPYVKPHVFAILDAHDFGPFIARLVPSFARGKRNGRRQGVDVVRPAHTGVLIK